MAESAFEHTVEPAVMLFLLIVRDRYGETVDVARYDFAELVGQLRLYCADDEKTAEHMISFALNSRIGEECTGFVRGRARTINVVRLLPAARARAREPLSLLARLPPGRFDGEVCMVGVDDHGHPIFPFRFVRWVRVRWIYVLGAERLQAEAQWVAGEIAFGFRRAKIGVTP